MKLSDFLFRKDETYAKHAAQDVPIVMPRTSIIWLMPAMLCTYMLALVPFGINPEHWLPMFICLALSCGFAATIQILWKKFGFFGASLLFLFAPVFFVGRYFLGLAPVVSFILFLAFVITLLKVIKLPLKKLAYYGCALFFGGGVLMTIILQRSGSGYAQPFMDLSVHKDTLFHVAISSMLKTSGVASIGLDGLTAINYHTGSHTVLAAISLITKLSVFDTYAYVYPLVIVPLILTLFLCFSEEVSPYLNFYDAALRIAVLSILVLGVDSPVYQLSCFWDFLDSESYVFAIILLLGLLSALVRRERTPQNPGQILNTITIVLLFIFAIVTKISVGLIALVFIGVWALLAKSETLVRRICLTSFCAVAFLLLKGAVNNSPLVFAPFHFVKNYIGIPSFLGNVGSGDFRLFIQTIIYFTVHLLFSHIAVIICGLYVVTKVWRGRFPIWLISGVAAASIVGVIPGLIAAISGGSAYYFSNISQLVALPLLLMLPSTMGEALLSNFAPDSFRNIRKGFTLVKQRYLKSAASIRTAFVLTAVFFFWHFAFAFIPSVPKTIWGSKLMASRMILEHSALYNLKLLTRLREVRGDPSSQHMLIYIPRTETAFWKMENCDRMGFVLTAVSEMSALRGLPSPACNAVNYGYADYDMQAFERSQLQATDVELKREARQFGFLGVVVLTEKSMRILKL